MLDHIAPAADDTPVGEILEGLLAGQKTLPAKLFYDDAGCALFNEITALPEYYVTRAETALLERHAGAIAGFAPEGAALVEYGAADESKAVRLLEGARFSAYVPIDIATSVLEAIAARMRGTHPGLQVWPVVADFLAPLRLPVGVNGAAPFGFFPGSTIGNLEPAAATVFLRQVRATLRAGRSGGPTFFVVGTDLPKDPARLLAAYDDAAGVTAAFNRNILVHVNRVAEGDLDPEGFVHEARWNAGESRIEMHLRSRGAQSATVGGRTVRFRAGETIHTENSVKYSREALLALAGQAGWNGAGFWTDPDGLFGTHLLRMG